MKKQIKFYIHYIKKCFGNMQSAAQSSNFEMAATYKDNLTNTVTEMIEYLSGSGISIDITIDEVITKTTIKNIEFQVKEILNSEETNPVINFVKRIESGEQMVKPLDIQFYNTHRNEIESELKKRM